MSHYKDTFIKGLAFFFLSVAFLTAEDAPVSEEVEPELPVEEALALIDQIVPLPSWDEPEEPDSGALLFPGDLEPDYELLRAIQLEEVQNAAGLNAEEQLYEPSDLDDFFSQREVMFIRDPNHFLTTQELQQLQDLLISHAGESSHNIHLNLLPKIDVGQIASLSGEKNEAVLKGDEGGVIIYYFYDDPNRTTTYFSPKAKGAIPREIRQSITNSAIEEATIQGDSFQSIYRYMLDMTLGLTNFLESQRERDIQKMADELNAADAATHYDVKEGDGKRSGAGVKARLSQLSIPAVLSLSVLFLLLIGLLIFYLWHKFARTHRFLINDEPFHLSFPRGRGCSGRMEFGTNAPTLKQQEEKLFR